MKYVISFEWQDKKIVSTRHFVKKPESYYGVFIFHNTVNKSLAFQYSLKSARKQLRQKQQLQLTKFKIEPF